MAVVGRFLRPGNPAGGHTPCTPALTHTHTHTRRSELMIDAGGSKRRWKRRRRRITRSDTTVACCHTPGGASLLWSNRSLPHRLIVFTMLAQPRLAELAAARVDSCCREPASSACYSVWWERKEGTQWWDEKVSIPVFLNSMFLRVIYVKHDAASRRFLVTPRHDDRRNIKTARIRPMISLY